MTEHQTAPQYESLLVELRDAVAIVYLNRPDKANAMNAAIWRDLHACFDWIDQEPAVRVAVLAGNGKHFCAGLDLQMFAETLTASDAEEAGRAAEKTRRIILQLQDDLTAIERCSKPVLAAIHYTCIGGGVDMTCCCDMRYCTEDAYFAVKEIDLGMVADVGTLQRLPRIIGDGMMRELSYTGRQMDAQEALRLGFVNRVFSDRDAMLEAVVNIAQQIASKSPLAIRGTKEMIRYARDHSVEDGLNYVATWNAAMSSQEDLLGSIQAQGGEAMKYQD